MTSPATSSPFTDSKDSLMKKTTGPLAASVEAFVDDQTIAGAVLLTGDSGGASAIETLGYAEIDAQRPMQPDTLFWIASNSKQITAAALMLLVDEGKIALSDPVSEHLPEFQGLMFVAEGDDEHKLLRKPTRPLTVRDLLSHTGGVLPWFHDGRLNAGSLRERTLACALTPLRFEPGTRWEYGNGGFEVAGRLIEVLSGLPLELDHRLACSTHLACTIPHSGPPKGSSGGWQRPTPHARME